ncbi:MAG: ethanolamine ammonia-lyase subunit EutC [Myxococcales bacterium]|nr:ethanolamine ammonia-lyase subunit EutC [Myxococcales bacterium]
MSVTRKLIADLRLRLGHADPMAPPPPLPEIARPPQRVFPSRRERSAFAASASKHTTALVGIGAVGTRYATDVVLQFQAELAVAHGAVGAELPDDWAQQNGLLPLQSRVGNHREFLLRPDLGRRLDEESRRRLEERAQKDVDVQPILADGLSAVACMGSGLRLLEAFSTACRGRGLSVGTPICAKFARVWLEDEIGEVVRAKVACILLGERPGLGTGDGLSAYMVYQPSIGKTDGERNMISNIHPRGMPPEVAGTRLALLAEAMIRQRVSGVELDLTGLASQLGEAAGGGYRAPQERVRLVEVLT